MAKIGPAISGYYEPKTYTGKFSVQGTNNPYFTQYRNKPQPQWPPPPNPKSAHAGKFTCDFHHCQVCKKPVKDEPHGGFCGELNCKTCDDFTMLKKPITGRHYTGMIMDDLEHESICGPDCELCKPHREANKSKKEVKMNEDETQDVEIQTLYEVITTYGGDRENVIVERTEVVAESETRALMQAKDDINSSWDIDYVDQHVVCICDVRVKRKLREILQG